MTNISVMRVNFEGTEWKKAFAESVMRLRPDMNPDRADELSDAEYVQGRQIDPAVAALRWFDRDQPGLGAPRSRASNGE